MLNPWSYTGTSVQNDWHSYLKHYASPYYDPVKAHQYYEEHKKLKGRMSTAGLSKSQKEIAGYVKKQITDEKKTNIASNKEEQKAKIAELKNNTTAEMNKYTEEAQGKIDSLREELKAMRPADRKMNRLRIARRIEALKNENDAKRKELTEQYKLDAESTKIDYANQRTQIGLDADEKYIAELDKLRAENSSGGGSSEESSGSSRGALDRDMIKKLAKTASDKLEAKKKTKT